MRVGVIGAGFCGLTTAYELSKAGFDVSVFEKEEVGGGLASDFEIFEGVKVERFVHHWFESDKYILNLINELGLSNKLYFTKSKDANFYNGKSYPFASALDLLKFSPLSLIDRFRLGLTAFYLKKTKNWKQFESQTAVWWMKKWAGLRSYEIIWELLLKAKFGEDFDKISMAWLWARIFSRTPKLGYLQGGFDVLATELVKKILNNHGKIFFRTPVIAIESAGNKISVKTTAKNFLFDKIIITVPASIISNLIKEFPEDYKDKLNYKHFLEATALVLVLKRSFMPYYWLNVLDTEFPFFGSC